MKKLFLFFLLILTFHACEKEQARTLLNDTVNDATIETRADDPAMELILSLIAQVNEWMETGVIDIGTGNSILSKLESIQKKLEEGKTQVALTKLDELIAYLETLVADGVAGVTEELIQTVEAADCETEPYDEDGDGSPCNEDCDDTNPNISPLLDEICDNGIDDNCDGRIDEDCSVVLISPAEGATLDNSCSIDINLRTWDFDWEDYPGATEYRLFVMLDRAQNPAVDVLVTASEYTHSNYADIPDANLTGWFWRVDAKVDGAWIGWSEDRYFEVEPLNTDCPDGDGDGSPTTRDCDDTNPDIYPGNTETCGNGIDDNCDGFIDEGGCANIILVAPANGATLDNKCFGTNTGKTWSFDWEDYPGATEYRLYVMKEDAQNPAVDVLVNISEYDYYTASGWVPNTNLTGWFWRVNAKVNGAWTGWSVDRFFEVESLEAACL